MIVTDLLSTLATLAGSLALSGAPADGLAERCSAGDAGAPGGACVCLVRGAGGAPMPEPAVLTLAGLLLLGAGAAALRRRQ